MGRQRGEHRRVQRDRAEVGVVFGDRRARSPTPCSTAMASGSCGCSAASCWRSRATRPPCASRPSASTRRRSTRGSTGSSRSRWPISQCRLRSSTPASASTGRRRRICRRSAAILRTPSRLRGRAGAGAAGGARRPPEASSSCGPTRALSPTRNRCAEAGDAIDASAAIDAALVDAEQLQSVCVPSIRVENSRLGSSALRARRYVSLSIHQSVLSSGPCRGSCTARTAASPSRRRRWCTRASAG